MAYDMTGGRTAPADAPAGIPQRVGSHAELMARTARDPFVRWGVPRRMEDPVYALGPAVAFVREGSHGRGRGLMAFGPAKDLEPLLSWAGAQDLARTLSLRSVSVPQPQLALLERHFAVSGGGDWDWMWTTALPERTPVEGLLVELDDTDDAAEIMELTAEHSPSAEGEPGTGLSELWLGARDQRGRLIACAAMQRLASGYPHLAGITVAGPHRGRGLGWALTAALTRQAIEADGVCTLGMYSDNHAARRLYQRLGYRTAHSWASRRLS